MRRLAPLVLCLLLTTCTSNEAPDESLPGTSTISRGDLKVTRAYIPRGRYGRHRVRHMRPRYITVHSTQNYHHSGDARAHALMLRRGQLKGRRNSLGYVTWHYTVDDHSIYQSLPDREQGQHADYEGPGNRYSIGIEMCENRGNSRRRTVDKTARLVARLMREHNIPLSRVVPHYHWPRIRYTDGRNLGQKNCPHFLLNNGQPGSKWRAFLRKADQYYKRG